MQTRPPNTFQGGHLRLWGSGLFGVQNADPFLGTDAVLNTVPVPEPGTLTLLGLGILSMFGRGRWRRKNSV